MYIADMSNEVPATRKDIDEVLNVIRDFMEQAAGDNQFAKLLEWARKVSEKTGIPLEKP